MKYSNHLALMLWREAIVTQHFRIYRHITISTGRNRLFLFKLIHSDVVSAVSYQSNIYLFFHFGIYMMWDVRATDNDLLAPPSFRLSWKRVSLMLFDWGTYFERISRDEKCVMKKYRTLADKRRRYRYLSGSTGVGRLAACMQSSFSSRRHFLIVSLFVSSRWYEKFHWSFALPRFIVSFFHS